MIKQSVNEPFELKKIYIVKAISDLIPGDITLHPIYREDGLLLVNKYTELTSVLIKQIQIHINRNIQAIVSESKEYFSKFLVNKLYINIEFINILKDIVNSLKGTYNIPISIESFVDERIDLTLLKEDANNIKEITENLYYNETINKMISVPLWQSLELILESEKLQTRAKNIKSPY